MAGVDIKLKVETDLIREVTKKLEELGVGVEAGILEGATTVDGQSIAPYAAFNEYGTGNIPARPFMRGTVEKHANDWANAAATMLKRDMEDGTKAMTATGELMAAHIKENIQNGKFIANAPGTVKSKARKGKIEPDHPLIDTGQMLAAVSYEVTDNG